MAGFGGVALLTELRRTGPLTMEETLGGTADLALSAGLESVGGCSEGDEPDEVRFVFWGGVLVAVVAMVYRKRWVCWYCSSRPDLRFRDDPASEETGKRRDDVLDHVQSSATGRISKLVVTAVS